VGLFSFLRKDKTISRLSVRPPQALPDRTGLAIAACMKDEGRHLPEWLAFHRGIGVRAVYLYDDDSSDDSRAAALRHAPWATVIPWAQRVGDPKRGLSINNQVLAYAHAVRNFGAGVRWMAFIDIDEFLVPTATDTIDDALAHLGDIPNVSLPWHMFGRNGHATPPAEGTLAGFLNRAADPLEEGANGVVNFKALVDPARVSRVKVHGTETGDGRTWNDAGRESTMRQRFAAGFLSNAHLQLNHYYSRSDAELQAKITKTSVGYGDRRRADTQGPRVMARVAHIEARTVTDRRAADLWAAMGGMAGEGNRTLVVSLGSFCSTIELHPRPVRGYPCTRPSARSPAACAPLRLRRASG
jgi:hypothetical protein